MTARELRDHLTVLVDVGHGDEEVFLDTGPHGLHVVGAVDLDADGVGVIIWKE